MRRTFCTVMLISLFVTLQGQVNYPVHALQSEQFRNQIPPQITTTTLSAAIQKEKSATSTSVIFGYLPDWGYPYTKNYLRYDILSHIAVFDFQVDSMGNMKNPSNWPWTDVITKSSPK